MVSWGVSGWWLEGRASASGRSEAVEAVLQSFAPDPERRALRLGPMGGDARALMDGALRAAFIRAVQSWAGERVWGLRSVGAGRWVAAEDGAGFVLDAGGVWLLAARREGERRGAVARIRLVGVGRGGAVGRVGGAGVEVRGNEARYAWRVGSVGLQERWVHGPLGMEQWLVVSERPQGRGVLEVVMRVEGQLRPQSMGAEVWLVDARGRVRARYGELYVRDARGERVGARIEVRGRHLLLRVEDGGAVYPLEIDPLVWVEQGRLLASDGGRLDEFGTRIAISADGNSALIGAPRDASDRGSAYLFTRTAGGWVEQAKFVPSGGPTLARFGTSVALSSDGSTAIVGSPGETRRQGAAYVFVSEPLGWALQARLEATDRGEDDDFGSAVALGADGNTAFVGAPIDDVEMRISQGPANEFRAAGGRLEPGGEADRERRRCVRLPRVQPRSHGGGRHGARRRCGNRFHLHARSGGGLRVCSRAHGMERAAQARGERRRLGGLFRHQHRALRGW
ncbi:MAG: FG-GAP repeat protein [Myxococcota bacterium]|nr:FG-GAP repeat protein [Myxococcota bacterium]